MAVLRGASPSDEATASSIWGGRDRHEDEVRALAMRFGLEHRVGHAAGHQRCHLRVVTARPEDEMEPVVLPEPQVGDQDVGSFCGQQRLGFIEVPSRAHSIPRSLEERDRIGPIEGVAVDDYHRTRDRHNVVDRTTNARLGPRSAST